MDAVDQIRTFPSNEMGVDRSEFAVTVGFAREIADETSDDAFLVQRSTDPNEDEPGVAGIYIEIPPQRYAMYGGIVTATLRPNTFEVRLTPAAAKVMGGNAGFLASFNVDAQQFRDLREGLRFVFHGCACYTEANEAA